MMEQHSIPEAELHKATITDLTPPVKADIVTPDITMVTDSPNAMSNPLTADRLHALL